MIAVIVACGVVWQPRAARGPAGRPHAPRERLRLHRTQCRAAPQAPP
jgi:hypothetical protein